MDGTFRARVAMTSALVLIGMMGAAAPAYSAPEQCPRGPSCSNGKPDRPEKPEDKSAPAAPLLGEAVPGPDGLVQLPLTAEKDAQVVVRERGEIVAEAVATGATQALSWSTRTGTHTYRVSATDEARNKSEPAVVIVEADATPPTVELVATSGTGSDTRSLVELTTEPDTDYVLFVDGEVVDEGSAAAKRITRRLDLADGPHQVGAEVEDAVGNVTTVLRPLEVRITALDVDAEVVSEPDDKVQVVSVTASAATTGTVRIADEAPRRFRLQAGRARIRLDLGEGTYEDVTVTVRDDRGRSGRVRIPDMIVDSTAPVVTIATDQAAAAAGLLSLDVVADEGTAVAWRLLDEAGRTVRFGEYHSVGAGHPIEYALGEGTYDLEVTATDAYGRTTQQQASVRVTGEPVSTTVVVGAVLGIIVALGALGLAALALWRRRRATTTEPPEPQSRKARRVLAARQEDELARFEQADALWQRRHEALSRLLLVAQGTESVPVPVELSPLPDERLLYTVAANLTEAGESGESVEATPGELLVTDQRVVFVGEQHRRDWWHSLVAQVRHLDHRHTTFELRGSPHSPAVEYEDPEITRLYVDLARSGHDGGRATYLASIEQGLRHHEMRRPTPPEQPGLERSAV